MENQALILYKWVNKSLLAVALLLAGSFTRVAQPVETFDIISNKYCRY
jgi:hypothetical protein